MSAPLKSLCQGCSQPMPSDLASWLCIVGCSGEKQEIGRWGGEGRQFLAELMGVPGSRTVRWCANDGVAVACCSSFLNRLSLR